MKIVMELHCPDGHDSAEESDLSITARIVSRLARTLSGQRCPACPTHTLESGLTLVDGRDRLTGFCPCCGATWLPGQRMRLLAAGRLIGVEPAARRGVRS
ncbi:hypothetical protein [Nocardia lijiangensis]|uniref:hypothetical protein n=1 Tax=Nocardia lijiangensis TaxID=299618 RepID=UPI00082A8195|nr:hypothetical protein [Nocardia lijiangensis]